MAIEDIVVNFHGGTAIGGNVNDFNGGSGTLSSDLSGFDTGAATGVSLDASETMTGNASGRSASSPTSTLATDINTQGSFSGSGLPAGSTIDLTFTFPSSVTSVDFEVYHCTTFAGQTSHTIDVNGTVQSSIDATNNTTGTFSTFAGIVPNGSNQIVVSTEDTDTDSNFFVFTNGLRLLNIVDTSNVTGTIAETLEDTSSSASGVVGSPPSITGTIVETLEDTTSVASGSIATDFVSDTFDGTGSLGSHWSVFDNSGGGVTSVGRVSDYFEGTISDNTGNQTTWFNTDQGRFDYQTVTVPSSGVDEYIATGIGVGPTTAPLDDLPFLTGQFSFCGLMVHDNTLTDEDYMFTVIGHRGSSNSSTIEIKGTTAGDSTQTDEGGDVLGTGVTHGDLRVEIDSSGIAKFSYRALGDTTWIYINTGNTGLVPASFSLGSSGTQFKIGIVGYAFNTIGVPFKFTANSMSLTGTPTGTINEILEDTTSAASGLVGVTNATGTIDSALDSVTSVGTGLVIQTVTGTISITLDDVASIASGVLPVDSFQSNEAMIGFFRAATGLSTYSFNELAIAYYKQAGATALSAFNDSLKAAQQAAGFVGLAPTDWRNL